MGLNTILANVAVLIT